MLQNKLSKISSQACQIAKRVYSRDVRPIRWIRRIGQNHPILNSIQLQPHTSTENILV